MCTRPTTCQRPYSAGSRLSVIIVGMRMRTAVWVAGLAFAMAAACDPAEPPEYLPLGGEETTEFDRGNFVSSDDGVLRVTSRDTSRSVCSGIALLGCPGQEHTSLRTVVTVRGVAEGEAELRGKTEREPEIVVRYKVERTRGFEVRTVDPNKNEDHGILVPEGQKLELARDATVVVQIYALGESKQPLGYDEPFDVDVVDDAVANVHNDGQYSFGWRATVTALSSGSTILRITTESASRDVALRVR